ncbi:hypothetical protein EJ03DRAFT_356108 [Teratosphaeria nubilosa]|uniref:BTB domain-containing protein n=1 Tax=Teratosphaeria nubilosa TaxID=161662 RepID=A0A6G1KTU2_9PEZI|nr:hypothetical protein EJ03DRAFT_356108 [Teratosphaeria nubilosa]
MSSLAQPPVKRRRLKLTENFTVIVGNEKQKFEVQKSFLAKSSDFFKTCCNGTFQEATSRIINMPETIFDEHLDEEIVKLDNAERHAIAHLRHTAIFELAILGDFLQDTRFRNAVLDAFCDTIHTTKEGPDPLTLAQYYARLSEKAPLRRLLVDCFAVLHSTDIKECEGLYPYELIWDVMMRLKQIQSDGVEIKAPLKNRCNYHEQDEEHPRCT